MFKSYHIMILKDKEGKVRSLHLRGWLSIVFFSLFFILIAINIYLWTFFVEAQQAKLEILKAQHIIQEQDGQLLSLAGKIQILERDMRRVQLFDSKLRVLMNIGVEQESSSDAAEQSQTLDAMVLQNPELLAQHRELFSKKMHSLIEELAANSQVEEVQQQKLIHLSRSNKEILNSTPSIWPAEGYLSSSFGYRKSPFTGRQQMHSGIDIANRPGTKVSATANGLVTFAGIDGAYGNTIVINHGNNLSTRYAHLQKILVKVDQTIQRGDIIGLIGSTGRSTGPHLHYEVRVSNVPVNPMNYILN